MSCRSSVAVGVGPESTRRPPPTDTNTGPSAHLTELRPVLDLIVYGLVLFVHGLVLCSRRGQDGQHHTPPGPHGASPVSLIVTRDHRPSPPPVTTAPTRATGDFDVSSRAQPTTVVAELPDRWQQRAMRGEATLAPRAGVRCER